MVEKLYSILTFESLHNGQLVVSGLLKPSLTQCFDVVLTLSFSKLLYDIFIDPILFLEVICSRRGIRRESKKR